MADFYQNGTVTTLHNLAQRDPKDLAEELLVFSKTRPLGAYFTLIVFRVRR